MRAGIGMINKVTDSASPHVFRRWSSVMPQCRLFSPYGGGSPLQLRRPLSCTGWFHHYSHISAKRGLRCRPRRRASTLPPIYNVFSILQLTRYAYRCPCHTKPDDTHRDVDIQSSGTWGSNGWRLCLCTYIFSSGPLALPIVQSDALQKSIRRARKVSKGSWRSGDPGMLDINISERQKAKLCIQQP